MLNYPHPTAAFVLSTDASDYAIGGTLKQIIDGKTHYNYFLSRLLTQPEKNYPTIDREALAIFWCLEKLQHYLGGRQVEVMTDHQPLANFHRKRKSNSKRIDHWLVKHQDIVTQISDIKYRKGSAHGDADGMSRPDIVNDMLSNVTTRAMAKRLTSMRQGGTTAPCPNITKQPIPACSDFRFSIDRVRLEQDKDEYLKGVKQDVKRKRYSKGYLLHDDVLYKRLKQRNPFDPAYVLCIPNSMHEEVLNCYHDHPTAGHFGVRRTWLKMKDVCYWKGMKQSIYNYIQSCDKCARFNIRRARSPGHLRPVNYPEGPLELVSMDFWGPTQQPSVNGNRYVLIITDYFTKYVVAVPVADNTAKTTAKAFLQEFIFRLGVPRRLITDRGVHFANELMHNLTILLGINHIQTSAYHPQANGLVERFNATFHVQLAKLCNDDLNDWDEYLSSVIYAYNTGTHSTTGFSPYQLMFVRKPFLPLNHTPTEFHFNRPNQYWNQVTKCFKFLKQAARSRSNIQQEYSKRRYDANRIDVEYRVNDLVLWRLPGYRGKFQERFSGPYTIVKATPPSYTIQHNHSHEIKQVHVGDLKLLVERKISNS